MCPRHFSKMPVLARVPDCFGQCWVRSRMVELTKLTSAPGAWKFCYVVAGSHANQPNASWSKAVGYRPHNPTARRVGLSAEPTNCSGQVPPVCEKPTSAGTVDSMWASTAVQKPNIGKTLDFRRCSFPPQRWRAAVGSQRAICYQKKYQLPGALFVRFRQVRSSQSIGSEKHQLPVAPKAILGGDVT